MKINSIILPVINLNGKTAYNPTIPINHKGKKYLGLRVESLMKETDSQVFFAEEKENKLIIDYSINSLKLQDPAYVKIKKDTLILGVNVWEQNNKIEWKQDIYIGESIEKLEYFTSGPIGMKDIRLVDFGDRIGVFTRPQGIIGGKGKIGYFEISNINELKKMSNEDWYEAELIENMFNENEWGGVNQAIKISNDEIKIIGHIAHQSINKQNQLTKHYNAMSFKFNIITKEFSEFKKIAERKHFPNSNSKRSPELDDIIFPSGIDNSNYLYCGISDYCIGKIKI
jgi:hypothetical protein